MYPSVKKQGWNEIMNTEKTCPSCGTKLSVFFETSMLGCPNCYRSFANELKPILREMHGKIVHVGKNPGISGVDYELIYAYDSFLREKEKAILDGDTRKAAEISEELKELSKELEIRGLR